MAANGLIKNSIYLNSRIFITVLLSLVISRILLTKLGVYGYGVYNIISSVVLMFAILNNAMMIGTQRSLAYQIARPLKKELQLTFSMAFNIHLIIAVLSMFIAFFIGKIVVYNFLNISNDWQHQSYILYNICVASLGITILTTPFVSLITAVTFQ